MTLSNWALVLSAFLGVATVLSIWLCQHEWRGSTRLGKLGIIGLFIMLVAGAAMVFAIANKYPDVLMCYILSMFTTIGLSVVLFLGYLAYHMRHNKGWRYHGFMFKRRSSDHCYPVRDVPGNHLDVVGRPLY